MSVYTTLTRSQIESFIAPYGLGELIQFQGISAGIENTNYLLTTVQGDFVLTIYEHFSSSEVFCYLELLLQLASSASYYPYPLVDQYQESLQVLLDKPAALFNCLPGKSLQYVSAQQQLAIATALASLHSRSTSLQFVKKNRKGLPWLAATVKKVANELSAQDLILLNDELAFQQKHHVEHLPRGVIHADLFKDNVLFVEDTLTGMLDFYAACCDCYLLDIAITLNDWCISQQGEFQYQQQALFMQTYQQIRQVSAEELAYLPLFLRRASLRFWLSRLEHKLCPRVGEVTQEKDPDVFKKLLLQHRQKSIPLE
ncbi:MAG: homoserine kinase type II [Methyloprofundus sp.]|nr:MAG: homoserine kinase type II [Methyloprofundus sp.]